ncbi:hypothetical protein OEZ85_000176 [Tetradesmus obliquus]|uniref:Uncharacterized protein n=1 Tax=Tetradesmus obliquus TaxID=3088 RepID=A0ABY8USV1_TETOB|nr:hypothetical protein OEZ85_000176 [Tetradesmus obliquus]
MVKLSSKATALAALGLLLLCGQLAPAAAGRGARLKRRSLLQETNPILPQPDFGPRIEGPGQIGSVSQGLRTAINDLAAQVPRIGSSALTQTATTGDTQAQRRQSVSWINTLPLITSGITEGRAAANVTGEGRLASAVLDDRSVSVAKGIVSDNGKDAKTLGSAASAQGVSIAQAGDGQQAGTELGALTVASAGEKALDPAISSDGSTAGVLLQQRGIGQRTSTRAQTGTLAAVAPENGGPTNYGGSVQFAAADSEDRPGLSVTRDLNKAENTAVNLAGNSNANRYGYTWSNSAIPTVVARGTENAYGAVRGGEFGTGFHFGGSQLRAITYKSRADPKIVAEKKDENNDDKPDLVEKVLTGKDDEEPAMAG